MQNLWGTNECSKGWGHRCPEARSHKCKCECKGLNHGTAILSNGEPIKSNKEILFMVVEVYKKRLGYVARGTLHGHPYSFAGFTHMEALEKALNFIKNGASRSK